MSKVKSNLKGSKKTKKFIPNLTATPNHICFKNYEEGNVYKENIQILNKDLKTYHLAIKFDNPEEIKLSIVGSVSKTRIDSGEDILFEVEFRPLLSYRKESVDRRYEICLNVVNANAKLFIPVLILSPNPVINFPREIYLPDTAVGTPAYSNIFILNYSNQYQKFSFDCRGEINIIPDCKTIGLKASDGSTFLIEFVSKSVGSFREKIHVCFDNGKKASIVVRCNVIPINIFLNEDNVDFSPTFIGMIDSKVIHIINNSEEASYFEWIPLEKLHVEKKESNAPHASSKYLQLLPMNGELQPNTITTIKLIFKPEDTDNDEYEVLKEVFFSFALKLSVELDYQPLVNVRGKIVGPNFQLDKKQIDIGTIFLGESRYVDVKISNTGVITGKVLFQRPSSLVDGIVKVSSKMEIMKPGESKLFKMKYLARKAGKFVEQSFFKVKNGEKLLFAIQGVVKPLEIDIEPKFIQFLATPICIPKLQLITFKNNLPFDVEAKLEIENNGNDEPLEFLEFFKTKISEDASLAETSFIESKISLDSTNKSSSLSTESCSSLLTRSSIKNFMEKTGRMENLRDSVVVAQEGITSVFNRVDEYLMNTEIVQSIVRVVFDGKDEENVETKFIEGIIMDLLVESFNDSEFTDFKKFDQKDWVFPKNPRELELNKSSFKLLSTNEKKNEDVKLFLTPNFIGKFTRNLKLKLLMSNRSSCPKQTVDESIINIPIIYDCQPPELIVHNRLNSIEGYAESELTFDVLVENVGPVEGFFSFTRFADHEMEVKCDEEKFFIANNSKKSFKLTVTPLKSGLIVKYVNLIVLGSNRKFPISIECKSLPPDILVKPNKIFEDELEVLIEHFSKIFIENRSTSKARFFLRLEHENEAFDLSCKGGILGSKQKTLVMLEKLFYDPGEYRDILIVEIHNSKVIKIPIKCSVRKLPILIEPNFSNSIDFGTLFISKTPYFLEYNFRNAGRNSYMIFIILKNWKSRNESRFLVEPNRFEILPNSSQIVKFYLNAENPLSTGEEFTIEGCSIHFPIREIIRESVLNASIIRPSVSFSENEIVINCLYNDEVNNHSKLVRISNNSNLPLPIALKVEGEFSLLTKELKQCEQRVKFDLKVKESRQIVICFNSNLIQTSCVARSYSGKLKAYSLGKLQCTMNLQANIIYPTINVSCKELNIINNLLPRACSFSLTNCGEMESNFSLNFNESSTIVTKIQEQKQEKLLNIAHCLMKQKSNLRETFFKSDSKELEIKSILNEVLELSITSKVEESKELEDEKKTLKMNQKQTLDNSKTQEIEEFMSSDIEVTLSDIQKFFKQLTRALSKTLCTSEQTLRETANVSQAAEEIPETRKFFRLSQLNGTLKPQESRMISVFFVGSSEAFHISTTLTCNVLGGISHDIIVNLTNCNPNLLITKTLFEIPDQQEWDEILLKNVCLSNLSPAHSHIELITDKSSDDKNHLIRGYVKLNPKSQLNFVLDEQRNSRSNLKFSVFMGGSAMFDDELGIQVNDKPPYPISIVGRNSLQTATLLNIKRNSLKEINKDFEYDCLRQLFKSVNQIRVPDEDVTFEDVLKIKTQLKHEAELSEEGSEMKSRKKNAKKDKKKGKEVSDASLNHEQLELGSGDGASLLSNFELTYDINGSAVLRQKPLKLYSAKMLHMIDETLEENGFEVLDYPDEYPEPVEITNYIAQQGFAESLKSDDIFKEFKMIYNNHVLEKHRQTKTVKFSGRVSAMPEVEKEKCVVPLPLILQRYEIDLGVIQLNSTVEKTLKVYFHGNPKSAALRTESFIPDFSMKFLESHKHFHKIIDFEVTSNGYYGIYQNRHERERNIPTTPMKRCHSFDFTAACVHSRKVPTAVERMNIHRTFNEAVKKDERSCYVQSEIHNVLPLNESTRVIEFKVALTPSGHCYESEADFDEIIYFDIHLGPQIPVNIKAKIVQEIIALNEEGELD